MTTDEFIETYRTISVADVALRARQYPDVDAAFALQQIEGWQRARTKLPTLAATKGWLWPARLSMEQCSSEETARYKASLLMPDEDITDKQSAGIDLTVRQSVGIDLTGGFGIDTFYLSEHFEEWHYVEQDEALCGIAEHNFALAGRQNIRVHHEDAVNFIGTLRGVDCIFADPARRDGNGGKVFRLEDCTPDIVTLYPMLMERCRRLMLKLSPMLDLQEALRQLPDAREIHIVGVRNEVKEVLIICEQEPQTSSTARPQVAHTTPIRITAVDLRGNERNTFVFTREEEASAECLMTSEADAGQYLYEPDAVVLKAGAFRLAGQRFGLKKAATSTHLYLSDEMQTAFPGRIFRILAIVDKTLQKRLAGQKANIICRNYPLRPDELKKKLRMQDGGEQYIIGMRLGDKPTLVLAERIK